MMHSEYKWLDRIDSPDDLKKLSGSDLRQYCDELRQYIIEQCSSNPGHLASSLGGGGACRRSALRIQYS